MSFIFGDFNTDDMPELVAPLKTWTSLAGLNPQTVSLPGADGLYLAGATLGAQQATFDACIQAASEPESLRLADVFTANLAPHMGIQRLTPGGDDFKGWVWPAMLAGPISWQPGQWRYGKPWQLRADVSFLCPEPYGYAWPDEAFFGVSGVTVNRTMGNMPSYPRIELTGAFNKVTLSCPGWELTIDPVKVGPGQKLILDYQNWQFAVWQGDVKVAYATSGMSSFDRPSLPLGETTIGVAGDGIASVAIYANSRRA